MSLDSAIFYSIVDLHAITVPYDPTSLRKDRDEMWCVLHAVGIDMQRCIVFEQSAVAPMRTIVDVGPRTHGIELDPGYISLNGPTQSNDSMEGISH